MTEAQIREAGKTLTPEQVEDIRAVLDELPNRKRVVIAGIAKDLLATLTTERAVTAALQRAYIEAVADDDDPLAQDSAYQYTTAIIQTARDRHTAGSE